MFPGLNEQDNVIYLSAEPFLQNSCIEIIVLNDFLEAYTVYHYLK